MRISILSIILMFTVLLLVAPLTSSALSVDKKQDLSKEKDNNDNKGGGNNKDKDKEKGDDHDNRDKNKDKDKDKGDDNDNRDKDKDDDHDNRDKNKDKDKDNRDKDKDKDKDKSKDDSKTETISKPKKGRLDSFSEPYRKNKPARTSNKSHDERQVYYASDDDDDEFWGEFFSDIFVHVLFGDAGFRYSGHPYNSAREPSEGIYLSVDDGNDVNRGNLVSFQFKSDYQRVAHNIRAYEFYGKLSIPSSLTIDMSNHRYTEEINNQTDSMNYFDMHFGTCAFTAESAMVADFGLGFATLRDTSGGYHGSSSVKLGFDFFPGKPLSIHVGGTYAAPANERLIRLYTDMGWHSGALEWFMGYHNLMNSTGDNLDGPVFGIALWF